MIKEILKVFSKKYREETKYIEYMKDNIDNFKLKDNAESVEDKVNRLRKSEL